MPRYFLHVWHGTGLAEDTEGQEFASLNQARGEAMEAAREIMGQMHRGDRGANKSAILIAESTGRTLETVPFTDALELG